MWLLVLLLLIIVEKSFGVFFCVCVLLCEYVHLSPCVSNLTAFSLHSRPNEKKNTVHVEFKIVRNAIRREFSKMKFNKSTIISL